MCIRPRPHRPTRAPCLSIYIQNHNCVCYRYAIGDNPASDIEGANGAGWESILVQTGVFKADQGHHPAKHVVHDVKEALRLILELEGRPLGV